LVVKEAGSVFREQVEKFAKLIGEDAGMPDEPVTYRQIWAPFRRTSP